MNSGNIFVGKWTGLFPSQIIVLDLLAFLPRLRDPLGIEGCSLLFLCLVQASAFTELNYRV